ARGGRDMVMVGNSRDLVYYRLEPSEAALLDLMDGTRTVGEIVMSQLDTAGRFDVGEVAALVSSLRGGGFLTAEFVDLHAAWQRALAPRGVRAGVARSLRTLTWEWSGAEKLTTWLYRHGLRALFTRAGAFIAACVALLGLVAFVAVVRAHGFDFTPQSVGV